MPYVITKLDTESDTVSVIGVFDDNHEDDAHSNYSDFRILSSSSPTEEYFLEEVSEMNELQHVSTNRCRVYLGYDDNEIHISAIREDHDVKLGEEDDELTEVMDFYAGEDEDVAELRNRALQTVSTMLWESTSMDEEELEELIDGIEDAYIPENAIRIDYREFNSLDVYQ